MTGMLGLGQPGGTNKPATSSAGCRPRLRQAASQSVAISCCASTSRMVPAAHLAVEEVLDGILLVGVRLPRPRFGPQVCDVLRSATQLESHQVIQFHPSERLPSESIGGHAFSLDRLGDADRWTDRRGVAAATDGCRQFGLRNAPIHRTRRANRIR